MTLHGNQELPNNHFRKVCHSHYFSLYISTNNINRTGNAEFELGLTNPLESNVVVLLVQNVLLHLHPVQPLSFVPQSVVPA
jgi:hypothetical protein